MLITCNRWLGGIGDLVFRMHGSHPPAWLRRPGGQGTLALPLCHVPAQGSMYINP